MTCIIICVVFQESLLIFLRRLLTFRLMQKMHNFSVGKCLYQLTLIYLSEWQSASMVWTVDCQGITRINDVIHYIDVIMTTVASQITSLTVVYSIVYSGADQRKHQSRTRHWPLCGEFTGAGEFPAQMASNAENVSIWWRHHCQQWFM